MKRSLQLFIPKLIVGLVALFLFCYGVGVFLSGGCALIKDYEVHEDGYFQYIIMGETSRVASCRSKAVVAIVGFTESGKEQEAIDIPREIDGKPVLYVGYTDDMRSTRYYIESENLKKLYVHDNIVRITNFEAEDTDLMLCSVNENLGTYGAYFHKRYVYRTMLDNDKYKGRAYAPANIVFMNNYSTEINGGYYRLDNISEGEKIPLPPNPERSGYEFTGWYTEPECINAWDFETPPAIDEDTEFRLYAAWRAI